MEDIHIIVVGSTSTAAVILAALLGFGMFQSSPQSQLAHDRDAEGIEYVTTSGLYTYTDVHSGEPFMKDGAHYILPEGSVIEIIRQTTDEDGSIWGQIKPGEIQSNAEPWICLSDGQGEYAYSPKEEEIKAKEEERARIEAENIWRPDAPGSGQLDSQQMHGSCSLYKMNANGGKYYDVMQGPDSDFFAFVNALTSDHKILVFNLLEQPDGTVWAQIAKDAWVIISDGQTAFADYVGEGFVE